MTMQVDKGRAVDVRTELEAAPKRFHWLLDKIPMIELSQPSTNGHVWRKILLTLQDLVRYGIPVKNLQSLGTDELRDLDRLLARAEELSKAVDQAGATQDVRVIVRDVVAKLLVDRRPNLG